MPTWPIAAASLVAGFAVADLTGVRALGGLVLLAAATWCFLRWRERVGSGGAAALVAFAGAGFVLSHVIADTLGTWGAVLTIAALVGAAVWLVADRAPAQSTMR